MSFLNQWDLSRYQQAKAFANFHPTDQLDLGLARDLMWAAQLAYELDMQTSAEKRQQGEAGAGVLGPGSSSRRYRPSGFPPTCPRPRGRCSCRWPRATRW